MVASIFSLRRSVPATKHDVDLESRLINFLDARHVPERESVHIDARGGVVVIRGPLRSARAKWLCLECCRHVAGVIRLVDKIVIEKPSKRPARVGARPRLA